MPAPPGSFPDSRMTVAAPSLQTRTTPGETALDDPIEWDVFTRWSHDASGVKTGESALQISGMHCAACATTIEQALAGLDGVLSVSASAAAGRASVRWDPARSRPSAWVHAIRRAGYDAVPDAAAPARGLRRQEHRTMLWRLFVASFCAMQVMMFATPSYVAGPGDLSPDMRQLLNWGSWLVSLPVVAFSATPFLRGAWRALVTRRIGMDVPVALGVLITFLASTGATFDPDGVFGHEVYFDSLTMFVAFLLAGRFFEMRTRHRAADSLESALACMPEVASRLESDGVWREVSVRRLRPGDRVRVAVGQAFPADGRLREGRTTVDEALLTGESTPVAREPGSILVAGSLNVGDPVVMDVERVGADTRFQAIVSMMRDAMTQRPGVARIADRWAGPFLWAVLVAAGGAALAWSFIDHSRAVWVAVAVLVVTCPCALSLAVPSTLLAAAGALARRGVIVQRLESLESMALVRKVFLDKTGTLTEDRPRLAGCRLLEAGLSEQDLLARAASLAQWSTHPYSRALVDSGAAAGLPARWAEVVESVGQGMQGRDEAGHSWRLGSRAWAVAPEGPLPASGEEPPAGQVWLSREGRPLAVFSFDEPLREDAQPVVRRLQRAGRTVTLLSGDESARVRRMAERLGLEEWVASASPEGKLQAVAQARTLGQRVAMVGDGVNDAPVLAAADVSLAMGHGALVSRSQADAVIASDRLSGLADTFELADRAAQLIRQNLVWALVYNAACIPLAVVGWLPPWAAGLGMALSSVLVVLNAMRVGRARPAVMP